MESRNQKETKERMIHVRLPETMHKEVRIRAAEADETIQEWVAKAIEKELHHEGQEKTKVTVKRSKGSL